MKPSGIGGQAVIEGVMMKNKDSYAIAVRKPDGTVVLEKKDYVSKTEKHKLLKLPILRGIVNFIESLAMGIKVLGFSASFFEDEEEDQEPSRLEKSFTNIFKEKSDNVAMGITVALSMIMAVVIFILLPYFISELIASRVKSTALLILIEGVLRIVIFVSYIYLISKMKDIQRIFMYHGAEHKTINCIEHGYELTVDNVKWQSREHKRCGTSFTFLVMFISIIFFMFIRVDSIWLRVLIRLLLVPIISGVSYEFIKLAGRSDSSLVRILSKPGLLLQKFTTREPDDDMIEVAIASVDAVFDWKAFIETVKADNEHLEDHIINDEEELSADFKESEVHNPSSADKDLNKDESRDKQNEEDMILQAVEKIVKEH